MEWKRRETNVCLIFFFVGSNRKWKKKCDDFAIYNNNNNNKLIQSDTVTSSIMWPANLYRVVDGDRNESRFLLFVRLL